jgi:hypothetical protein
MMAQTNTDVTPDQDPKPQLMTLEKVLLIRAVDWLHYRVADHLE